MISDQVNIHKQISENQLGGVVRTDTNELSRELTRWMSDANLRREASERARKFVFEEYDAQKIANRWTGHYQQITRASGLAT